MILHTAVRKELNRSAHTLALRNEARIRGELELELEAAQAKGAKPEELIALLRRRVDGAG